MSVKETAAAPANLTFNEFSIKIKICSNIYETEELFLKFKLIA